MEEGSGQGGPGGQAWGLGGLAWGLGAGTGLGGQVGPLPGGQAGGQRARRGQLEGQVSKDTMVYLGKLQNAKNNIFCFVSGCTDIFGPRRRRKNHEYRECCLF